MLGLFTCTLVLSCTLRVSGVADLFRTHFRCPFHPDPFQRGFTVYNSRILVEMTMAQPKFNTEEAKKDFSNPEIVKRYVQYRPTPPTSIVSTVLDFLRQEKQECDAKHQPTSVSQVIKDGGMSLCVDVGCGSGQSTEIYADHFERVIGLDVSQEQLDAARVRNSRPNLSYWEGQGEDLPLEDESVDLITCSSSFHWLNVHAFFAEVQRVLRPGGVLACYWYRLPECHYGSHSLSDIFEEVWESWKEYWPACHHFVMNDYVELPNLYPDQVTVRSEVQLASI